MTLADVDAQPSGDGCGIHQSLLHRPRSFPLLAARRAVSQYRTAGCGAMAERAKRPRSAPRARQSPPEPALHARPGEAQWSVHPSCDPRTTQAQA